MRRPTHRARLYIPGPAVDAGPRLPKSAPAHVANMYMGMQKIIELLVLYTDQTLHIVENHGNQTSQKQENQRVGLPSEASGLGIRGLWESHPSRPRLTGVGSKPQSTVFSQDSACASIPSRQRLTGRRTKGNTQPPVSLPLRPLQTAATHPAVLPAARQRTGARRHYIRCASKWRVPTV